MTVLLARYSHYSIAGQVVALEFCDGVVAEALRRSLICSRCIPVQVTARPIMPGLLYVSRDNPLFDESVGCLIRAAPHWRCYADEQKSWFVLDDARIIIPLAERGVKATRVEVFLFSARNEWPPDLLGQIFGCAIHALLQPCGLHFLHGAGLVAPNSETGVLIVGASGSGKSTLALRLAMVGWRYLSDDLLLIGRQPDNKNHTVVAHAFRRHFAVSEAVLSQCGLSDSGRPGRAVPPSARRKRWLDPDAVWPGRYAPQCVPQILVFPQLTDAPTSRWEAMTPQEAFLSLCQETPLVNYDLAITRDQVQTMTALARQAQSWRLYAGRDLLEVPDRAAQLFADLTRSCSAFTP